VSDTPTTDNTTDNTTRVIPPGMEKNRAWRQDREGWVWAEFEDQRHPGVIFERIIRMTPGYHGCNENTSKDYGINGVEVLYSVRQRDGHGRVTRALDWQFFTPWLPYHLFEGCTVRNHDRALLQGNRIESGFLGSLGMHWPDDNGTECYVLGDAKCAPETWGYLISEDIGRILTEEGDTGVWRFLVDRLMEAARYVPDDE